MSDNIKLDEILNGYKVGELKELAKASGVTGYSKLKKAELIEAVSVQLQTIDIASIELPEELQNVLVPTETIKEENVSASEKKTDTKKTTRSSTPIIGVAPHVMNVMQSGQAPVTPINRPVSNKKIYPNEPCPCGSGKKYKKCCGRL